MTLSDHILLETTIGAWNTIDPGSPVFAALSQMREGDQVFFSGTFNADDTDCVEEMSITLEGSMTDPEFAFRFTAASAIGASQQVVAMESKQVLGTPVFEPAAPKPTPAPEVAHTASDGPESHDLREDGRVYSVALVVATPEIPLNTKLFAQGRVASFGYAGMRSRPFAVIDDEQQPGKTLLCAMMGDEGAEVVSLYHVGEAVQVSGDYMGTFGLAGNPSMPIISHCEVAGPQNNVVRPLADAANTTTSVR